MRADRGNQASPVHWQAAIAEVRRLADGPSCLGTRHMIMRTFLGRRLAVENEYTAFEPGRRIVFRTTSGLMQLDASYLVEPVAEGTRVTSTIAMEASGFVWLAKPLIAVSLRREVEAAFRELKSLMEAPALTGSPEAAAP